jgi:hypothetical protein
MNFIPEDLGMFDFAWSSCAFEHLGSLEKGMQFVVNTMKHIKPGGWATHTTEFNLSSNTFTVSEGGSVYYRQQDIEEIGNRLADINCELTPVNWSRGDNRVDTLVDIERKPGPHCHLKLQIDGFDLTSIVLIIKKVK